MKYRMYVDEVGNSDLGSSDNPIHRFLSLTGVIIELGYVRTTVHPKLEALKLKYFDSHPDDPIIFHRKEILNAKFPFLNLRNPKIRKEFDRDLLKMLNDLEYKVISVCLDKKYHKETYKVWRYDPYHYCLALLLERYTFFLEKEDSIGDVLAESRGGKEDNRLKKSYTKLWEEGTEYLDPERFQAVLSSKQLKIKPKLNNIAGLQISDLLAHPSRNEILKENDLLEKELAPFARKIVKILANKYYQKENKIFGKKFI